MEIKLRLEENKSGDAAVAGQGFGRISETAAPRFKPAQVDEIYDFFATNGYVVIENCLSDEEVADLNGFFDRTQQEVPEKWGLSEKRKPHHRNQGLIFSQPLLDHPELDGYLQHPSSYPVVEKILGGKERVRFSELNFRETPENAGIGQMNFHHDRVSEDRFEREPYMPVDWLCAIHYLTDVDESTPKFCVVPRSNRFETLTEAFETLGDDYVEQPITGPAGTCVMYDTATYHTRLDGDGVKRRRTWHQYYARGGWLRSSLPTTDRYMRAPSICLTDWNLFPERLAMHPDPAKRLFFSHWNTAQGEWVASGFDPEVRASMPRGNQ